MRKEDSNKIQELRDRNKKLKITSYENIENLIKIFEQENNNELTEYLEDYKYYIKNKKHRDFSRWLKLCGGR